MAMSMEFHYRLSAGDYENLKTKASTLNISCADYLRLVATLPISMVADNSSPILVDQKTFNQFYRELNHWGTNYNQGIKALNAIALRLKKSNLSEAQQRDVVANARIAETMLASSKDGIFDVHGKLEELKNRLVLEVPTRLLLKLEGC